jgi:DNA primase
MFKTTATNGPAYFTGNASAELPRLDFGAIAESIDLPRLIEGEGIEIRNGKALCPFHDNTATPALSVYRSKGRWKYKCHGCQASGDAIGWVSARENITAVQAARRLGGDPDNQVGASTSAPVARPKVEEQPPWKDAEWQRVVEGIVVEAERRLGGPEGRAAMRWLNARGLEDHTIRRFRLGFVAEPFGTDPIPILEDKKSGHGIYSPRGITIPWLAPGACYSPNDDEKVEGAKPVPRWTGVNVRRLADDVFAELPEENGRRPEKYMTFRGSRRGHLYPWPEILQTQGELPMLLVEGEFDALLATQEIGHLLHVATAGSASVRSLPLASRSALAMTTWILLAMDHDQAGVDAVWEWREKFPHKSRRVLLPCGKDFGEFTAEGGDARGWIAEIEQDLKTLR